MTSLLLSGLHANEPTAVFPVCRQEPDVTQKSSVVDQRSVLVVRQTPNASLPAAVVCPLQQAAMEWTVGSTAEQGVQGIFPLLKTHVLSVHIVLVFPNLAGGRVDQVAWPSFGPRGGGPSDGKHHSQ